MPATPPPGPALVNVPNALTVLRLVLVPVFVAFLLVGGTGWRVAAFFAFGVASFTDLLDGELARRSGLITDFGKIADPIADKALIGSALISLSVLGELSWWVTAIIMVREVAVTALRFWVIRRGVIPASRGGKVKTVLQVIAISLYILPVDVGWVRAAAMAAAVAVTLVTGVDYLARAIRLRQAVPGGHAAGRMAASGPGAPGRAVLDPAVLASAADVAAGPGSLGGGSAGPGAAGAEAGGAACSQLAEAAIGLLVSRGQTVATAESLTGGLVAAALTAVPGASAAFRGGIVAYTADLKATLLDVPADLLDRHGTVHAGVALAMAEGVRRRLAAGFGVATTGVAGPDPVDGQPPGTVHIAVSASAGSVHRALNLTGDRQQIRRASVDHALNLLVSALEEEIR
ncbi:MAG TPA: CDP-diacylglycerol--glycerol-3-phosphate 3-phosphatidyltransferase [Streptosporangiaceae bacterium]|nr:CDP-diacylglycerol--glycerol-3-phosphate 3-phosphatidyltransferase [Streptosporangiaceae bacterium]